MQTRFRFIFGFVASLAVLQGCVVVEDGTVGVSKSFGTINEDPLEPGVYANIPVIRTIEVWNVKTQRRSLNLDLPSSEGLIVGLQTTVLFRPHAAVRLRREIGPTYVQEVLDPILIDVFREVIGKQKVEEVITKQEEMTATAFAKLRDSLAERGVTIEDLMVTGLELPVKFKDAIERKLEQEQKAFQKQFELDQAKKDAEIEVARARGAAEAQEIVRSTLSPEYLSYLWISTLNQNPNVIYVATEANMPLIRTAPDKQASAAAFSAVAGKN